MTSSSAAAREVSALPRILDILVRTITSRIRASATMSSAVDTAKADLAEIYSDYVRCFFSGDVDSLDRFVDADVTRNGHYQGLQQYKQLSKAVAEHPGLEVTFNKQVVGSDQLSCQIVFKLKPEKEFLGFAPTGATVEFEETIIYEFKNGKIAHVWNTVNLDAVRQQMTKS